MRKTTRSSRLAVEVSPHVLCNMEAARGLWHETPGEVARGLRRGARKTILLAWVKARIPELLTPREAACLRLYYFEGLSCARAGRAEGVNASTVHRAVCRAVAKLRAEAEADSSWRASLARLEAAADRAKEF